MIFAKRIKLTSTHNHAAHHLMLDHHDTETTKNIIHKQQLQTHDDDPVAEPEPETTMMLSLSLIRGLPDHVAHLILARLPPRLLFPVSSSWRRLLYSPHFPPFPSLYLLSLHHTEIALLNYDPVSGLWSHLPPPPSPPRLLLRHPSFLSRNLPLQSLSVVSRTQSQSNYQQTGRTADQSALVLVAGTTTSLLPALPRLLVFSPATASWSLGPAFPVPRRWCAAGSISGSVFISSGIGAGFDPAVARSMEKWDIESTGSSSSSWVGLKEMRDGRYCREAIEAVGYRGKLYMVNVKGADAAKDGAVYDTERDEWGEMREGMRKGWRGPAAAMEEEVMYGVDESKGVLRRYEEERDMWIDVARDERLIGAQQMAAARGRVCVVGGGSGGVVVVDVVAVPARVWVVELPSGFDALAVHVLPRLSRPAGMGTEVLSSPAMLENR
ncbi:hypothetical protein Drorol1_Dr00025892 [Drosera rotundifolia]